VNLRDGLDDVEKRRILDPNRDSNSDPSVVQTIARDRTE
jgi:hypothetical protein